MKKSSVVLSLVGAFMLSPLACSSDGLIGGECADGFDFCEGACISVSDDYLNCGACNKACGRNLACVDGLCGGPDGMQMRPDALGGMGGMSMGGEPATGGISVGAGGPGGNDTGGNSSGGNSSGGNGTGGDGTGSSGMCMPPYDTPAACGDCNTKCMGGTPNCAPDGASSYECVANCLIDPYTTECSGECVDTETDAMNCGACSVVCPSGICIAGDCEGGTSGHMVAFCFNFRAQSPAQTRLFANSIFLANGSPVRILSYVKNAPSAVKNGVNTALTQAAALTGRSFVKTDVTVASDVTDQLTRANYDVLLVPDQESAAAGELATVGTAWDPVVENFTGTGGVVVVLTGGGGTGEMDELIDALGIFNATGTTAANGETMYVNAPGNAIGINVVTPYLAVNRSCTFLTTDVTDGTTVLVTADSQVPGGNPAVVHRIVPPIP